MLNVQDNVELNFGGKISEFSRQTNFEIKKILSSKV